MLPQTRQLTASPWREADFVHPAVRRSRRHGEWARTVSVSLDFEITLTIILGKGDPSPGLCRGRRVSLVASKHPQSLRDLRPVRTQTCPAAVAGSVSIAAPDDPMIPSMPLSTSPRIGSCADVTVDPTGSTGAGGRDWRTVTWEISGDGSQNATAIR